MGSTSSWISHLSDIDAASTFIEEMAQEGRRLGLLIFPKGAERKILRRIDARHSSPAFVGKE
jgi:hypothetical protein